MRKELPDKELYIYKLVYQEMLLHAGLDRLELSFEWFTLPELSSHIGYRGKTKFFIGWREYPFIFNVSKYKGFKYSLDLIYDYEWDTFECMKIMIGNTSPNAKFINKIIIEWKFFRCAKIDDFGFSSSNILQLIQDHFTGIRVLGFDYCMDIIVPKEHEDFLSTVYFESFRLRTVWNTHYKSVAKNWVIESLYDGDKDYKKNDTIFGRYYNKKNEIIEHWNQFLYKSYLSIPDNIFRFEYEFRRASCQQLDFVEDIMDSTKLFNLFHTKLESKKILIFWLAFNFDKVLIKREQKQSNKLEWWDLFKLDMLGKGRQAKGLISQLDKMEKAGIDIMALKEQKQDLNIQKAQEYSIYYISMLDGITEFFLGAEKVLYRDFQKEVKAHIEYIEMACWIPYSEFIKYIDGYIKDNLKDMVNVLSRPITCLIYFYFVQKVFPEDDDTFLFLKLFNKSNILPFVVKDLDKKMKEIRKTRTYSVLYQETTEKDAETAIKLVNYISNKF
jgi:hypothetical protein